MSRLPRPYIPLAVRVRVALRQCSEVGVLAVDQTMPLGAQLKLLLYLLFDKKKSELHHRPALVNRDRKRNGEYIPAANDPDFLIYLPDDVHDIETRVRGLHGAYSDLGLRRKLKRIERKAEERRTGKMKSRFPKGRKIQSRNNLRTKR